MNPDITMNAVLEERTPKSDGTYPIKIRLTYGRKQRYYKTKYYATKEEFEKIMSKSPRGDFKDKRLLLNVVEAKVTKLIEAMKEFTFHEFKKLYDGKKEETKEVFGMMKSYASNLREFGQIKTAKNYESALSSFKKFHKKPSLYLNEVTIEFIKRYEKSMLSENKSPTTIGMYLRTLRTMMNIAMSKGIITQAAYPFGRHKYQIPSGRKMKRAYPISHIQKIFEYQTISPLIENARNYWILSYLCNGMNMKDIALLKNKNICNDMIHFTREKTKNTSKLNLKPVTVYMTEAVKEVIAKLKSDKTEPDDFVFPILPTVRTPEEEIDLIELFIKKTNKYLKKMGVELNLEIKLTSYTARHSYATIMKRNNVPTAYISDSVGHTNQRTIEDYFGSFEDSVKQDYAEVLTNFKPAS